MKAAFLEPHEPHQKADRSSMAAVRIPLGAVTLDGDLTVPERAKGLVLFAHGSGSSRHSPRNQFVARVLRQAGSATLLFAMQ